MSSMQGCCSLCHMCSLMSISLRSLSSHGTQSCYTTEVTLSTPQAATDTGKMEESWVLPALLTPSTPTTTSSSCKEQLSPASPAEAKPSAQHWGLGAPGSVGTLQLRDSTNPSPDALGFNWRGDNRMGAVGKKWPRFSVPNRQHKSNTTS